MKRKQSILVKYLIVLIVSGLIGLIQELVNSELDELYPIDIWSIAHFVVFFGLTYVTLFQTQYKTTFKVIVVIFLFMLTVLYELFELFISSIFPFVHNFSYEIPGNIIADIIIDLLAIVIVLLIYVVKKMQKV